MKGCNFFISTLGCKVNQYESHAFREAWAGLGFSEVASADEADVILINSCAVTAKAVADVRREVRRLHRAAPYARIIITGCAAQAAPEGLAELPGVAMLVPGTAKAGLLAGSFTEAPPQADAALFPPFQVSGYDRSRAVLKIQDGCSHCCTYCIVPRARGGARSRSFEDALAEARRLLAAGFREITLSGINLRQFTGVIPGAAGQGDFWDFLTAINAALAPEWAGRARLRISSLEPGQLGQKALDVLSACSLVAPHLHLSLQSGSAGVLSRMGRGHYSAQSLPGFLEALRSFWPVFGLGADILTAFPGETDAEFSETLRLCRDLPLTYAHVFPYSSRPGTLAAKMPGHVPSEVKKERAALLREVVEGKKANFLASLLTMKELNVVFEQRGMNEAHKEEGAFTPGAPAPGVPATMQGAMQGLCEYYAECELPVAGNEGKAVSFSITPCRPLCVREGKLVVTPAPTAVYAGGTSRE